MPRATEPGQAEVCIRQGDGTELWATSFIVLWHDQFGTRNMMAQHTSYDDNPDSDLLNGLSYEVAVQLLEDLEQ